MLHVVHSWAHNGLAGLGGHRPTSSNSSTRHWGSTPGRWACTAMAGAEASLLHRSTARLSRRRLTTSLRSQRTVTTPPRPRRFGAGSGQGGPLCSTSPSRVQPRFHRPIAAGSGWRGVNAKRTGCRPCGTRLIRRRWAGVHRARGLMELLQRGRAHRDGHWVCWILLLIHSTLATAPDPVCTFG